jgi:hypothetical protein
LLTSVREPSGALTIAVVDLVPIVNFRERETRGVMVLIYIVHLVLVKLVDE